MRARAPGVNQGGLTRTGKLRWIVLDIGFELCVADLISIDKGGTDNIFASSDYAKIESTVSGAKCSPVEILPTRTATSDDVQL